MKKVVIRRNGGPEVLEFVEVADPSPKANEVLIDLQAVGLNWSEVMIRRGEFPAQLGAGFTPGAEGAGVVLAAGEQVASLRPGDRVVDFEMLAYQIPGLGNYAEKICVDAGKVFKIPDGMGFAEAAALPMAMLTAYDAMINHSPLPESGSVVVTACTGAVGIAALQIARRKGLTVFGVTRSKKKESLVAAQGVKPIVAAEPEELKEKVLAATHGEGVDYVFDAVNGAAASMLLELLRPNGTFVAYGALAGAAFAVPVSAIFKQVKVHGYVVLSNLAETPVLRRVWRDACALAEAREIVIPVAKMFPFEAVAAAHRTMEEHGHFGKLVLTR